MCVCVCECTCACVWGVGCTDTVVMHVCFSFPPLPLVIHTPCILQFLCWLIQQHVFRRCPLLTHLNRFHWHFVRMCLGPQWAWTGSLLWLLYLSLLNLSSFVSGRLNKTQINIRGWFYRNRHLCTDLSSALKIIGWVQFKENLHLDFSVSPFDVMAICDSIQLLVCRRIVAMLHIPELH